MNDLKYLINDFEKQFIRKTSEIKVNDIHNVIVDIHNYLYNLSY